MKKIVTNVFIILFIEIVWVVFSGDTTIFNLGVGFVFSIVSLWLTYRLFHNESYETYYLPIWFWFLYVFFLLYSIIKSALVTSRLLLTNNYCTKIVNVESQLTNSWYVSIVANSITLTPGTVTIEKEDQSLSILFLTKKNRESDPYLEIVKPFDDLFKMIDRRKD